jgi:hypothetical protein
VSLTLAGSTTPAVPVAKFAAVVDYSGVFDTDGAPSLVNFQVLQKFEKKLS